MMFLIFRNWKIAALWVVGVLVSTSAFFASGGGNEQLDTAMQSLGAQPGQSLDGPEMMIYTPEVDKGDGFTPEEEIDPEMNPE